MNFLLTPRIYSAALSMTLCEIATAEDHSPPLECAHFQAGIEDQRDASPGKCVS